MVDDENFADGFVIQINIFKNFKDSRTDQNGDGKKSKRLQKAVHIENVQTCGSL